MKKQTHNHKDENLLPDEFDGIRERNNPVPAWFNAIAYGTIIFAAVYFFMFHFMDYEKVAINQQNLQQNNGGSGGDSRNAPLTATATKPPKDWKAIVAKSENVTKGKEIFSQNCASCHGAKGEGGVGPNLSDNQWIVEPTFGSIYAEIFEGNLSKGMPAWGNVLGEEKINQLVAYLARIQNTNAPGGKAAEGTHAGPIH